ncbi:transporter substrate-binding domain-containing protein [Jeotgalibaca arthritidis]|uniref:Transporter substrate-binding domain-containing protein n=1 Tax=Jeotgalibaca arthritidis TaxID=1868794 RepID=A0A6G7KBR2_9LACT|nr:transporter substrate-binding domain-containing protein [Jeotgalibaca arthritidis]QII82641.1 transporter substrate-binding domain-containing protein [Jeotgalibaca arthritidis]
MRKEDTDLKAQIDRTIEEMRADGTYDEIYQNWFFSE